MAKKAKIAQTDWTRGGRDISNTAIPLYQQALELQGEHLADPQKRLNQYIQDYYTNTADQNDFVNAYRRAMANTTGSNVAATSGGYTSSGQRAYDDTQRYYNDLASRLQQQGVTGASNLVNNWYNQLNAGLGNYQNAYNLGQNYSKIEQYNDLVDQSRNNWIGSALGGIGSALMSSGNPWGMAIGGVMTGASGLVGTDTSDAINALGMGSGGSGANTGINTTTAFGSGANSLLNTDWKSLFGGK